MTTYDERVIKSIEETVNQYIKIYKRLPQTIRVSNYEFGEYKKALQNGVKPNIVFKGKEVFVNVCAQEREPREYDFADFHQRGKRCEPMATKQQTEAH